MKASTALIGLLVLVILLFRLLCGIFVMRPIGSLKEGATIVYWRAGLDQPFITSVNGMLSDKKSGLSLPGRVLETGEVLPEISDRELFRLGYSETIYNLSLKDKK
ncbi:MAG: hypothetical protein ACOYXB_11215 [Bacteroidota bacterium]